MYNGSTSRIGSKAILRLLSWADCGPEEQPPNREARMKSSENACIKLWGFIKSSLMQNYFADVFVLNIQKLLKI
jgi:hypothetical protein